jgi:hypothetical protein
MAGRFIDWVRGLTAKSTSIDGTEQIHLDSSGLSQKATTKDLVSYVAQNLAQTWNAAGTVFTALKMNVTDTASSASSLLIDLQVGGVSKFKVTKAGVAYITLPTSNPGPGILWNDGGTIKVGT